MDDSFGGGGFNLNATNSNGTETQKDGVLPVCIRQLLLVEEDVKMFNFSYSMVSLIAIIRKIDYTSTKITYKIEDHTGQIEAHFWLDDENSKHPKVTQNAYAKIIGSMRKVADQNVIIVYQAEEVEKINEYTTHLLEILYSRFKAEQLSKGGAIIARNPNLGEMSAQHTNGQPDMDTTDGIAMHGMTGKNALVFEAIKAGNDDNNCSGISRQDLYKKFFKIPQNEIDVVLEFLINEGFTYSTVSSDNFKTVE